MLIDLIEWPKLIDKVVLFKFKTIFLEIRFRRWYFQPAHRTTRQICDFMASIQKCSNIWWNEHGVAFPVQRTQHYYFVRATYGSLRVLWKWKEKRINNNHFQIYYMKQEVSWFCCLSYHFSALSIKLMWVQNRCSISDNVPDANAPKKPTVPLSNVRLYLIIMRVNFTIYKVDREEITVMMSAQEELKCKIGDVLMLLHYQI